MILDRVVARLHRRLDGPTVPFLDPDAYSWASDPSTGCSRGLVPQAGPQTAAGPAAADRWPVGAGRHANNCVYLDDAGHGCVTSYGDPIRPGQACFHSARTETLRHLEETA